MNSIYKLISLENSYIPSLLIIAIFSIFAFTNVKSLIISIENDGKIINISGRQRMLSQKLIILGMRYLNNPTQINKTKLEKLIKLSKDSHIYLLKHISSVALENIYYNKELDIKFNNYLTNFELLIKSKDNKLFLKLIQNAEKLLPLLSLVVVEHENINKHKVSELEKRQLYILLTIILFLIIEVIFIFYPASQKIKKEKIKDKRLFIQEEKQKKYFNTILESFHNAIIVIDQNKTILTYNDKAQEIFGFTKEEMIGKDNLLNIIPLKYKNLHTVASSMYFKTGKSKGILGSTLELEAIRKNGEIFPIRISFGESSNENSKIVVANISDITSEKQKDKDKALEHQSRLAQMGEMISMIAHQWRQPLTAISARVNNLIFKIMMKGDLSKEIFQKELEHIGEYSQHLSKTIDDFRGFFNNDKVKEKITLEDIVNSTLNIVQTSVESNNINIITNFNCNKEFETYSNELKQVILNLIKNAEDALIDKKTKNSTITIQSNYGIDNNTPILIIKDNAGGIPIDIIDNIFDPYFSTKKEKDGTGLGLYMSKTIIEDHCGGKLSVSNDNDGAVFRITL